MITQADFDAVVIGGGITGAATAASLAIAGKRVAIVDRARCGAAGATSLTGGIVRTYDRDSHITQLASRATSELRTTAVGRIMQRALSKTGVLHALPFSEEEAVKDAISQFASPTYPMTLLSRDRANEMAGFSQSTSDRLYLWEREGGRSDALFAVRSLLAAVRANGLVLEGHHIQDISGRFGDVRVQLCNGVLRAKVAVIAAGPWSALLHRALPIANNTIPLVRFWSPKPIFFPVIDAVAGTYALPIDSGFVQVGSSVRSYGVSAEFPPRPSIHHVSDARNRFSAMTGWPSASLLPLDSSVGVDGYSADGRPICGFVNEGDGIYVTAAMSGIGYKLAPAIASIATADILAALSSRTMDEPSLHYLRPNRFTVAAIPAEAQP